MIVFNKYLEPLSGVSTILERGHSAQHTNPLIYHNKIIYGYQFASTFLHALKRAIFKVTNFGVVVDDHLGNKNLR